MTLEDRVKQQLGALVFDNLAKQQLIETMQEEIEKNAPKENKKSEKAK